MTIDEVIKELKDGNYLTNSEELKIAEWLETLKVYQQHEIICNKGYNAGYNKAIDDFAEKLTTYLGVENAAKYGNKNAEQQRNSYDTLMKYEIADAIEDLAEQLKAGGKNV